MARNVPRVPTVPEGDRLFEPLPRASAQIPLGDASRVRVVAPTQVTDQESGGETGQPSSKLPRQDERRRGTAIGGTGPSV